MTIEQKLFERLSTDAALTGLVGQRIYPDELPQNVALPAISYQRVATDQVVANQSDPGNVNSPFQVNAWATTQIEARQVANAVKDRLIGRRSGAIAPWRDSATLPYIERAFLENDLDIPDRRTNVITYRVAQDFRIHYIE